MNKSILLALLGASSAYKPALDADLQALWDQADSQPEVQQLFSLKDSLKSFGDSVKGLFKSKDSSEEPAEEPSEDAEEEFVLPPIRDMRI